MPTLPNIVLASVSPAPRIFNFYATVEAAQADAARALQVTGIAYEPMTYDAYKVAQSEHYLGQLLLTEITAEQYRDALECLPPLYWERADGVERFCMSEMLTGPFTRQYATRDGRYVSRIVDVSDRATWITGIEMDALAAEAPATDRPGDMAAVYASEHGVAFAEALIACNID